MKLSRSVLLLMFIGLNFLPQAHGLILTGKGNTPVNDPGWPKGAAAVANLESRVGWAEGPPFGGGQWTFFYRGDTNALQSVLDTFAEIQSERLEVTLHDGSGSSPFLDGAYDWSLEVWVPECWNRLYNNPETFFTAESPGFRQPVAAPRLDIWLNPGRLEWAGVTLPPKVIVTDARATSHGFKPGSGSAIRAKISDAETGLPINSARVVGVAERTPEGVRTLTGTVADNSLVELSGLPAGHYRFDATAEGYVPRVLGHIQVGSNAFNEFTVALSRPAVLDGLVLGETDQPVSGVKIRAIHSMGADGHGYPLPETPEAVSDSEGRFQLTGLPKGSFQIWAYLAGFHHRSFPSEMVTVPKAPDSPIAVVRMEPTGSVRIQLVDENGNPVQPPEGAVQVHIQAAVGLVPGSWGGSANVTTNGIHVFESVPPGEYQVSTKPFLPNQNSSTAATQRITVVPRKTAEVRLVQP